VSLFSPHIKRVALRGHKGIPCPFGTQCEAGNGGEITPADVDTLVRYGHEHAELKDLADGMRGLEQADVEKLVAWLAEVNKDHTAAVQSEHASDPFIAATTKSCPSCGEFSAQ
jgi:hypothetical protein